MDFTNVLSTHTISDDNNYDLKKQLEENRLFLVRALRALDSATNECREEARNATARVTQLESALGAQSEIIVVLRSQMGQSRKELQDMSSIEQKIKGLEDKLVRDMNSALTLVTSQEERHQAIISDIKQLNRRMECTDFALAQGSKENEMNFNSLRCISFDLAQKLQKADLELANLSKSFADQESATITLLQSAESRLESRLGETEASLHLKISAAHSATTDLSKDHEALRNLITALQREQIHDATRINALEAHASSVDARLVDARDGSIAAARRAAADAQGALDRDLDALRRDIEQIRSLQEAHYSEAKSEIDSMFKGEMLLSKRLL